jgi:hypothetical protein
LAAVGIVFRPRSTRRRVEAGESDLIFVHASLRDSQGTLCVEDAGLVDFSLEGGGCLISPPRVKAEAGIGTALVRVPADSNEFVMRATRGALADAIIWPATASAVKKSPPVSGRPRLV